MTNPSQLRNQLQSAVIADLLGPANGPEEIVDERTVRDRYLVGKLGTKGQSPLPEYDDSLTVDDAEGDLDVAFYGKENQQEGTSDAHPRAQHPCFHLQWALVSSLRARQHTCK